MVWQAVALASEFLSCPGPGTSLDHQAVSGALSVCQAVLPAVLSISLALSLAWQAVLPDCPATLSVYRAVPTAALSQGTRMPSATVPVDSVTGVPESTLKMLRLSAPLVGFGPETTLSGVVAQPPLLAVGPQSVAGGIQPITRTAARRPAGMRDPVFGVGLLTIVAALALAAGARLRSWRRRRMLA